MRQKFLMMVMLAFLFGCSQEHSDKANLPYVIKHSGPQPPDIYGTHNFIILDSTVFYFHKEPPKYIGCGTGRDGRPERLFLTPDSLKQIRISELPDLLRMTYADSLGDILGNNEYRSSVGSPTDTIKNNMFKILFNFFKEKNIRFYNIRNWTEEEQYVALAKIKKQKYEPDSIKWEIGFDTTYTSYYRLGGKVDDNKVRTSYSK